MKNLVKKLLAVGLLGAMALTMFTGCSLGKHKRETIDSDTPWFDLARIEISPENMDPDLVNTSIELAGSNDDILLYQCTGSYQLPADYDWENDNYSDYQYNVLEVYDYQGNLLGSIDVMEAYRRADMGRNGTLRNVERVGDSFVLHAIGYSDDWSTSTEYVAQINVDDFEIYDFTEESNDPVTTQIVTANNASYEKAFHINGKTVKTFWINGDMASYIITTTDANGNVDYVDLRTVFPNQGISDISYIVDIGNGRGLIIASVPNQSQPGYYILDTNTMNVTPVADDMSWLNSEIYHIEYVEDYGDVVVNQEGISSIDYDNHTLVSILNFNNTNVNRYDVTNTKPIRISDDRVILEGSNRRPGPTSNNQSVLYVFDRAESNPNVGKQILTVASLGEYNYSICDTMCRFNQTNPDYFMQIDTRYALNKFYANGAHAEGVEEEEKAQLELGNQLSIDLMAGEGPDIIINGADFAQLNNDNYLLDLSTYASNLDSNNYFTNVIDQARTDGKLFQLPISFYVNGIVTDAANVEPDRVGFTYDEYVEFVQNVCNGEDPLNMGSQLNYFIAELEIIGDSVIENGHVNYDCDQFRALAQYVKDHVNNKIETESDEAYDMGFGFNAVPATVENIDSMERYISIVVNTLTEKTMVGLPTYDGRGPVVGCTSSVGVNANLASNEKEAALSFVSYLLDNDTQYTLGFESGIPINRNAFTQVGEACIDNHNLDLQRNYSTWTENDFRVNGMNSQPLDYSGIESLEQTILSAGSFVSIDGAINAIVREEIPAYFEGHKDIDSIISVLNNRVQTMLNERG